MGDLLEGQKHTRDVADGDDCAVLAFIVPYMVTRAAGVLVNIGKNW